MALSQTAKMWLSGHGFVQKSGRFYGEIGGYLLTVGTQTRFQDGCVVRYQNCDGVALRQALTEARKQKRLRAFNVQNKYCLITFKHSRSDTAYLENAIMALVEALTAAQVPDMHTCCRCGRPASAEVYVQVQAQSVCAECAEKGTREGNPFFGLIGAILGAAVGMIPWILVALMGYVSVWLAVLLALCSFWGYRLLARGAADYTKWIVLPVSLFFSLVAYFATLFIQIGEWVTPELLRALVQVILTEPEVIGEIVLVAVFSLAGVIIGAALIHQSIMRPLPQRAPGQEPAVRG